MLEFPEYLSFLVAPLLVLSSDGSFVECETWIFVKQKHEISSYNFWKNFFTFFDVVLLYHC